MYQGYFIDLDGTMYAGKRSIPAAQRFITRLKAADKQFMFVTNNSTQTPEQVAANLKNNHNIEVAVANIYTTAMATADYLAQHNHHPHPSVYIVGELGLQKAILEKGFVLDSENPDYVVVGLDSDVTYEKLTKAVLAVQNGATFIGTNPDTNIPKERGMLPGAGAVVNFVEFATQVKPIIIGKPQALILNSALAKIKLPKDQVVMLGDNYNTDIKAGINAGIDTLLVYSGVSTKEQVAQQPINPTHEIDSLDDWQF